MALKKQRRTKVPRDEDEMGPTHRVRVQIDFEMDIQEIGFPTWVTLIYVAGLETLVKQGYAKPLTYHGGAKIKISEVTEAQLRRRETLARKAGR